MQDQITVLLVDDHEVVRTGYRRLLEASGKITVVSEAKSGEEACQLHAKHEPDVVIMDLSMQGMSGLEAIRRIQARRSNSKILVFSMHENAILAERAIQAGAVGYITKSSDSEDMVEAVLQVAQGKRYLGSEIAQGLAMSHLDREGNPFSSLSQREFEVFELLVNGKKRDLILPLVILGKTGEIPKDVWLTLKEHQGKFAHISGDEKKVYLLL